MTQRQQRPRGWTMDKKNEETSKVTSFRRVLPQILAVAAKSTLQLCFGLSVAFPTMVIPAVSKRDSDLVLTKEQISWFGSLFLLVIPFGCLASGPFTLKFGRKTIMVALSLPFSAAWWFYSQARTPLELFAVVTLHGFINGLLEAPILTYVAEVCEPEWRGVLSSASVLMSLLGVSLQFFIGNYLEWREAALLNISVPLVSFVTICLIPESPHWLIGRGRFEDAGKSLRWLRGWVGEEAVKKELEELKVSIEAKLSKKNFSIRPYLKPSFVKPFSMVVVSFIIGHFSGMSTLQTYAVGIFESLNSPVDVYKATAIEGFMQFLGSLVCVCILPFIGRRLLAISTTIMTGLCLVTLAIVGEGWAALVFLLLSVFLINSCSKIFPWVLIGEVFSPDVRSVASGTASCVGYALGFLVNKTWFFTLDVLTLRGVFGFYGLISFLGAVYYFMLLPETEGRSLDEVQAHFDGTLDLTKTKKGRPRSGIENSAFSPDV